MRCRVCALSLARCPCVIYGVITPLAMAVRELVDPEPIPIEAEDQRALLRSVGQPLPKDDQ